MQAEILAPESEDFRSEQAEITPNALAILTQNGFHSKPSVESKETKGL